MTKRERFAGSITEGAKFVRRGSKDITKMTSTATLKMEGDMTTYFGQTDMGKTIFAIYRRRPADGITYQEQWMPGTSSWDTTTGLMRLLTGGDCTLSEIREEDAMMAFPSAFPA